MSDPVTWLIGALVASTAVSAYGTWYSGQSQANQFKAQERAANVNAKQIKLNAEAAAAAGTQREEQARRAMRAMEAKSVAAVSATGTRIEGSNLDLIGQNRMFGELDALNIRYDTEMQRRGLLAQSGMETYAGRIAGMNRSNAVTGSYINAASSLLSSGTSSYLGYQSLKQGKV